MIIYDDKYISKHFYELIMYLGQTENFRERIMEKSKDIKNLWAMYVPSRLSVDRYHKVFRQIRYVDNFMDKYQISNLKDLRDMYMELNIDKPKMELDKISLDINSIPLDFALGLLSDYKATKKNYLYYKEIMHRVLDKEQRYDIMVINYILERSKSGSIFTKHDKIDRIEITTLAMELLKEEIQEVQNNNR